MTLSVETPTVVIYTDGACLGNPGPGGYAAVIRAGDRRKEISGGFRRTTNNRMELMAAIMGLETLDQPGQVTVYTDSQYVANAITLGWARKWRAAGWMRGKKEAALNPDLWERLLALCDSHDVRFEWVRGHRGDPENERCDRLAVAASKAADLPPDRVYEQL